MAATTTSKSIVYVVSTELIKVLAVSLDMFDIFLMCLPVCFASSFEQETVLGRSWAR